MKNRRAIDNKIEAVEMLKEWGYPIKDACDALGISRSSYYPAKEVRLIEWAVGDSEDGELIKRIKGIKAEQALEMAINREFPKGVRGSGLKLISDNDSQR